MNRLQKAGLALALSGGLLFGAGDLVRHRGEPHNYYQRQIRKSYIITGDDTELGGLTGLYVGMGLVGITLTDKGRKKAA